MPDWLYVAKQHGKTMFIRSFNRGKVTWTTDWHKALNLTEAGWVGAGAMKMIKVNGKDVAVLCSLGCCLVSYSDEPYARA